MNAMGNNAESWEKLQMSTMNDVWGKIWPECVQNFCGFAQQALPKIHENIMALTNDLGSEDILEADIVELLQFNREDLSNEELIKLEQE